MSPTGSVFLVCITTTTAPLENQPTREEEIRSRLVPTISLLNYYVVLSITTTMMMMDSENWTFVHMGNLAPCAVTRTGSNLTQGIWLERTAIPIQKSRIQNLIKECRFYSEHAA